MRNKIFIISVFLLFHLKINAQNYIYRGDKKYESTDTWNFSLNASYWTGDPKITVAKNSKGGYLMISINVPFKSDSIRGTLTIILEDGTIIKCLDKGVRDYVDRTSVNLYTLTTSEIESMKFSRISKIRFNIYRNNGVYEKGEYTPYTANNHKGSLFVSFNSDDKDYYDTDFEIYNLFDE